MRLFKSLSPWYSAWGQRKVMGKSPGSGRLDREDTGDAFTLEHVMGMPHGDFSFTKKKKKIEQKTCCSP